MWTGGGLECENFCAPFTGSELGQDVQFSCGGDAEGDSCWFWCPSSGATQLFLVGDGNVECVQQGSEFVWMTANEGCSPICTDYKGYGPNQHVYKLFDEMQLTWNAARDFCAAEQPNANPHLVAIKDSEENDFVENLSPNANVLRWTGGRRTSDDLAAPWGWVTGEAFTYENWLPIEPNMQPNEFCLQMNYGASTPFRGGWNDATCDKLRAPVCEMDNFAGKEMCEFSYPYTDNNE
jgi:hypothetical protein